MESDPVALILVPAIAATISALLEDKLKTLPSVKFAISITSSISPPD